MFGDSSHDKINMNYLENSGIVKVKLGGEHTGLL